MIPFSVLRLSSCGCGCGRPDDRNAEYGVKVQVGVGVVDRGMYRGIEVMVKVKVVVEGGGLFLMIFPDVPRY